MSPSSFMDFTRIEFGMYKPFTRENHVDDIDLGCLDFWLDLEIYIRHESDIENRLKFADDLIEKFEFQPKHILERKFVKYE